MSQTYFVIKPEGINLKYLTGLLNSKLSYFWLNFKGKKQGWQLQVDKAPLLDLPIYKPESRDEVKMQEELVSIVDSIIETSKKLKDLKLNSEKQLLETQIKAFEEKIDDLVYKLYSITDEEKKVIEDSLSKKS